MKKEKVIYDTDSQPKNEKLMLSIAVALFFSFNLMFFVPLDFYLSNLAALFISIKYMFMILIPAALIVFAAGSALCSLTSGRAHIRAVSIIFGIGMAMYIQANFLSTNLTHFDGSKYEPGIGKIIINMIFWLAVISVPFLIYRFNRPIFKSFITYGSLFVFLIEVVTIITIFIGMCLNYDEHTNELTNMTGNSPAYFCETIDEFTYSSDKNYIVIIVDSYDSNEFDESITISPESVSGFDGFTYYANTVGAYTKTNRGVPYIFTGEMCDPPGTVYDELGYYLSPYDNDSLFKALEKNYNVNMYTLPDMFPEKIYGYAGNFKKGELTADDIGQIAVNFGRITLFKNLPEAFKGYFQLYGSELFRERHAYSHDNLDFYHTLPETLDITNEKQFKFIYLNGLHFPLNITADLERSGNWSIDETDQAIAVNKILSRYFDTLKENGVYDNSEIVLLADHGLMNYDSARYPLLMIKRAGETSEGITTSYAPISHDDVYPTLMYLAGEEVSERTIFDIGEDEERVRYFIGRDEYVTENRK